MNFHLFIILLDILKLRKNTRNIISKSPWLPIRPGQRATRLGWEERYNAILIRWWRVKWSEVVWNYISDPADRHVCHSTLLHLITISTEAWTNLYNQNQYSQLKIFKLIWLRLQTVTWHCAVQFIMLKCLK